MTDDVFSFVLERGVQFARESERPIVIKAYGDSGAESELHLGLRDLAYGSADRIALARAYVASDEFRDGIASIEIPLAELDAWLSDRFDRAEPAALKAFVKETFDGTPSNVIQRDTYQEERRRTADSLLAAVLAAASADTRGALLRAMYLFGLVEELAAGDTGDADRVAAILGDGVVALPADVFGALARGDLAAEGGAAVEIRIRNYRFVPSHVTVAPGSRLRWVNEDEDTHTVTSRDNGQTLSSGDLVEGGTYEATLIDEAVVSYACDHHPRMRGTVEVTSTADSGNGTSAGDERDRIEGAIYELRAALESHLVEESEPVLPAPETGVRRATGSSAARPSPSDEEPATASEETELPLTAPRPWAFPPEAVDHLSTGTVEAIERLGPRPRLLDVPDTIRRLETRAAELAPEYPTGISTSPVALLDATLVDLRPYVDGNGSMPATEMARYAAVAPTVAERNLARRPGIADLKVVRERLKRYELGEVAHIENVLQGEDKERVHKRSSVTEETILIETEREESAEQDVQTTDRFELQTEASSTIRDDSSLNVGATVTYLGPSVTATGSFSYASNRSRTDATRESQRFARDVTARSASRIQERIREERLVRTVIQIEETNKHGLDNATGDDHLVGLYRWVDKILEAWVVNYGRRLLLEFIVPEPASFYLHALATGKTKGVKMERPEPPMILDGGTLRPLLPTDLTPTNYGAWIQKYNADIKPPPQPYTTVSFALEEQWQGDAPATSVPGKLLYRTTKDIKIDPDYQATSFFATIFASAWGFDTYLAIGGVARRGDSNGVVRSDGAAMPSQVWGSFPTKMSNEVALALAIENPWGFALELEVLCERSAEALARWQGEAYAAITRAYLQLKSEYDELIAAAATRAGIAIQGRNPLLNRVIERTELKKSAISLLLGSHFQTYGQAIVPTPAPEGFPSIDFVQAQRERDGIQFFEQAFEWPALTYLLYPYFWGNHDRWISSSQIEDVDPLFAAFLAAGSARVVVPVRPGFEQSVLHYLATEQIWNGGQAPQAGDPLYVSIIQEIQEQQGAATTGTVEGDPWEVQLPTTLVMLQDDAELPVPVP